MTLILVNALVFFLSQCQPAAGEVNIHFHLGKARETGEEDVAGNVDYSEDNKENEDRNDTRNPDPTLNLDFESENRNGAKNPDPTLNIGLKSDGKTHLIEGDIIYEPIMGQRSWVPGEHRRWTNRILAWKYSSKREDRFSTDEKAKITKALDELNTKLQGCVQIVPHTNQANYVNIRRNYGCSSLVGMHGGRQGLSLEDGCVYHNTIQHEFLHALGVLHEQSRPDRDKYVRINWDNIIKGDKNQFVKLGVASQYGQTVEYNYESIMHYSSDAFSRNGRPTIVKLDGSTYHKSNKATELDLQKIRIMYKCKGRVNCGGHAAKSCYGCPQGKGASWCNGDCTWQNGKCQLKGDCGLDGTGIAASNVCCPATCVKCGGSGCHNRPGGWLCCAGAIRKKLRKRSCSKANAPCMLA